MKTIYQKLILGLFLFSTMFISARAAVGDIDTGFGTDGKVIIDFDGNPDPAGRDQDTGLDVAVQPDGKIIIIGESYIATSDSVFSVARLNPDGSLDQSFGNGGKALYNPTEGATDRAYGAAVQADGKILVAGRSGSRDKRVVIRLNPDGSLDPTFGRDGVFDTALGGPIFDEAEIAIQPDGKIIITGSSRNGGMTADAFSVMRLNPDGTLDTTFDSDGEAVTVFQTNDRAYGVALQPDGKILVSGATNSNGAFALARYNPDGSLDASFGNGGKVTTAFPGYTALAYNLLIQPDGKIIAAGYKRQFQSDALLIRYNPDGSLDNSFGDGGQVAFGTTSNELLWDVHLIGGKIVGTGYRSLSSPSSVDDFMIVSFDMDGSLDTGFGQNGVIYTDLGTTRDTCLTSAIQPDGNLVLGGYTTGVTVFNPDFAAVRYNFNRINRPAPLDFNGDGKTDFAILRPAGGLFSQASWWISNNGSGEVTTLDYGLAGADVPVPADYDGDGKTDIAVFRQLNSPGNSDNGYWYILESSTQSVRIEQFGQGGDDPTIVDDFDGDGKADLAVFRAPSAASGPGQTHFFYRASANNPNRDVTFVQWGTRWGTQMSDCDKPYTGDFDGDGRADFAVQRPVDFNAPSNASAAVFLILTANGEIRQEYFGLASDRLVPGDYDGDGKTDIAVARGFNHSNQPIDWFIRYSGGQPDGYFSFGKGVNTNFAQGDYDGDGKTDIALWVKGNSASPESYFWILPSRNPESPRVEQWGLRTDIPVAAAFNR
ncbi:MAG: FG-GAP-like repeat-containing protein [Pyrinomonadaceae bacterium]